MTDFEIGLIIGTCIGAGVMILGSALRIPEIVDDLVGEAKQIPYEDKARRYFGSNSEPSHKRPPPPPAPPPPRDPSGKHILQVIKANDIEDVLQAIESTKLQILKEIKKATSSPRGGPPP